MSLAGLSSKRLVHQPLLGSWPSRAQARGLHQLPMPHDLGGKAHARKGCVFLLKRNVVTTDSYRKVCEDDAPVPGDVLSAAATPTGPYGSRLPVFFWFRGFRGKVVADRATRPVENGARCKVADRIGERVFRMKRAPLSFTVLVLSIAGD